MHCFVAPGLATLLMFATSAHASPALAKKHNCTGCHAATTKLVGPAFDEVARKYTGQTDALAAVTSSIRGGGSGKWGELAMPPQPQLSPAEATALARWVLGGAKK